MTPQEKVGKKKRTVIVKKTAPEPSKPKRVLPANRISPVLSEKRQKTREREQQALELRKARVTFAKIAEILGFANAAGAKLAVDRAIRRQGFEQAHEVVMLDLQTLDELQMRLTEQLRTKNDLRCVDGILRVMQQRYAILGVSQKTRDKLAQKYGIDSDTGTTGQPTANGQVVNNTGVMIISGSSTQEFVKQMMIASGVDPNAPAAQKKLKEIESGPPAVGGKKKKNAPTEPVYMATPTHLVENDIIDAEIVEE